MESDYRPTEYIVDFGDSRSNQFVRLNMAMIEQNSARLHEKIVRCRDCVHYQPGYCKHFECMEHQISVVEDDYCSFGVRRNELCTL